MKNLVSSVLSSLLLLVLLANGSFAQLPVSGSDSDKLVPPVFEPGLFTCANANNDNVKYPNVVTNAALINNGPVNTNSIATNFRTHDQWVNVGPVDLISMLQMQGSHQFQSPNVNGLAFSLQLQPGIPKSISAVILSSASGSNVYAYASGGVPADATLTSVNNEQITHIEFCYNPSGTTVADVSVSGRVSTQKGAGIARAQVTVINGATGERVIVQTSSTGNYEVQNLDGDQFYTFIVTSKAWTFNNKSMTVDNGVYDLDFVGKPRR